MGAPHSKARRKSQSSTQSEPVVARRGSFSSSLARIKRRYNSDDTSALDIQPQNPGTTTRSRRYSSPETRISLQAWLDDRGDIPEEQERRDHKDDLYRPNKSKFYNFIHRKTRSLEHFIGSPRASAYSVPATPRRKSSASTNYEIDTELDEGHGQTPLDDTSILRSIAENGVLVPRTQDEMARESNKHYLMNTIFGRNYFVPFDNVKRALDINTGTGVWALEMATDFPNTLFLGVDSEACYPQSTMPPNCRFESMNILEGLNCASELFDYVHIRFQLAFIPTNKWQTLLLEVYRVTCPGGWIEIVEWDAFYRQGGPISNRMTDVARKLLAMRNCDPTKIQQLDGKLTDAGFMQVTTRAYDVPLGLWGGKIGQQMLLDVKSIASVIAPGAIQAGLFGPNEVPSLVEEWEKEIEITKPYVRYYVYTGQRPG